MLIPLIESRNPVLSSLKLIPQLSGWYWCSLNTLHVREASRENKWRANSCDCICKCGDITAEWKQCWGPPVCAACSSGMLEVSSNLLPRLDSCSLLQGREVLQFSLAVSLLWLIVTKVQCIGRRGLPSPACSDTNLDAPWCFVAVGICGCNT